MSKMKLPEFVRSLEIDPQVKLPEETMTLIEERVSRLFDLAESHVDCTKARVLIGAMNPSVEFLTYHPADDGRVLTACRNIPMTMLIESEDEDWGRYCTYFMSATDAFLDIEREKGTAFPGYKPVYPGIKPF